jgi:hypothetical protein
MYTQEEKQRGTTAWTHFALSPSPLAESNTKKPGELALTGLKLSD